MPKPLFQKRHYQKIADTIRDMNSNPEHRGPVVTELIKLFRRDNPKFNEAKFWKAIENGNNK